ncbi:hypothetical protein GIB67_040068 [Kingdonia uniflora]|uniref:Uncharacterized protein n=1 Tax=Kingdonia uniflora TaxID=39325 RepID=A0A7J7MUP4_9MAGN|nr:hypothetical protein GIB67_040068 [Kingdonia uniflora]
MGKSHQLLLYSGIKADIILQTMGAAKIIGALGATFVITYSLDAIISDKKIFGGSTRRTVSDKEWWEETDNKFQAWPRTAGSPVVMNPISRQNFIVNTRTE